jgi:hypothetical protein
MMITFFISLLIIIILTYYYYQHLQYHFWYHLGKNLGQPKFYSGKLHPNIYSKKDLTEKDKNGLVQLYANYMEGISINKEKIENFLTEMPYSEIFYMKVNSIYYGAVMNSIIEIKYKNKTIISNFVDNAIINKYYRDKGIFKELMKYITNYSNLMNVKYIIFKIDRKPIPSFYEYNITSNYYYCCSSPCPCPCPCPCPFKKGANPCPFKKGAYPQIYSPYSENEDQFFKYKNSKDIIILSCPFENKEEIKADNWDNEANNLGVSPFFKGAGGSPFFRGAGAGAGAEAGAGAATTMIFKRNSPESIELLYIDNPNQQNIRNIVEYLYNNYSFKILMVDDIGNNSHLIKAYPESFKIAYPVYHYILGLKDKISKENFFYYF